MSISDLYSSGKHKQEIGHFASVVKMALIDNTITEGEQKLLDRTAKNLNISEEEYKTILKNPSAYPLNPPVGYDESIERLYRLTKMIFADDEVSKDQVILMRKIATALSFPMDNVEKVCDEAIHLVMNDNDLDDFTEAIKKVNEI
ncbi:TerB family tellurite resistance protein [Tenacibaculum sp. MEBiC06402]|uniref:TerB family tellurite resistance protein n=1 Tax=unclassified Tenacibaculum TaxID=2635139 RepID=UPI003B9A45E6